MKHKKNLLLCLIAILAIFSIVSCGGNELPDPNAGGNDSGAEIQVDKSENLDAWRRACANNSDLKSKKERPISIEVTGTVVTNSYTDTYLVDETGAMAIHTKIEVSENGENILKNGDKLTIAAKTISNYHNAFQAKDVTIIKHEKGTTPVTPKAITSCDSFDEIAAKNNYEYVTVTGRVMKFDDNGNAILKPYEKEPTPDEIAALTDEELLDNYTEKGIKVFSNTMNLKIGDVYTFKGHVTPYDTTKRISSYFGQTTVIKSRKVTAKAATFKEYQDKAAELKKTTYFLEPYQVKARLLLLDYKDAILLDENTGETIHLFNNVQKISNKINGKEFRTGDEIVVNLENIDFHAGNLQCTSFTLVEKTKSKNLAESKMIEKAKTITSFEELKPADENYKIERNLVTVTGKVTKAPDKYGFEIKLNDTDKNAVYIAKYEAPVKVDDDVVIYGCLTYDDFESSKHGNTPTISPNKITVLRKVKENSSFAEFKSMKTDKGITLDEYLQVKGIVLHCKSSDMILLEEGTNDVIHCQGTSWNTTNFGVGDEVIVNLGKTGNRYGNNLTCREAVYVKTIQEAKLDSSAIKALGKVITEEKDLVFDENITTNRDLVNIDAYFVKTDRSNKDVIFSFVDPNAPEAKDAKTYRIVYPDNKNFTKGDKIHITGCLADDTYNKVDDTNTLGNVIMPAHVEKVTE